MSYGALMTSVSFTIFVRDDTPYGGSYNISRSMQFGTGVGISVGIFGLPWFLNFSFSISDETHLALGFVAGEQFDEAQCEALRAARDGGSRSSNMELAASALRNHQIDAVGTEAVLLETGLDALAEMLEQIGAEEGRGPEDGIPALSNGDFFGEFLARDADALVPLDETADTSLDALLTRTYENIADNSEQFDDLGVIEAVVEDVAFDASWVVPDLAGLADQVRAAPAVTETLMAADAVADAAVLYPGEDPPGVVDLSGQVGEAIPITVTVDELISRYPGLTAEILEGADVVFESLPSIEATPFAITGGEVAVTMTRDTPGTVLLDVWLDAATLAEPLPGDLADRNLSFDYRLADVVAGPPAAIELQVPPVVTTGTELRATAVVVDAYGNRTGDPVLDVDFTGPRGEVLNAAPIPSVGGAADLRIVPVATIPTIDTIYAAILVTGDGEEVPGYVLEGTGISADACLYIDGELFEDAAVLYSITAPEQVLWAQEGWIPLDGEHEIQVVNPGDVASDPFTHEFVE